MNTLLFSKRVLLLLLGLSVMLVSCDSKPAKPLQQEEITTETNGIPSSIMQIIKDNIELLSKEINWDESQKLYGMIKFDIGNKEYDLELREQKDLNSLSDKAFCHSMDTIMFIIMSGECKSRHSELFAIHKRRSESDEFSKVTVSSLHVQVEDMFANHENMRKIIVPELKKSKQKVTSFETPYCEALPKKYTNFTPITKYEKEAVNSAASYLEQNPTCKEIKDGLTYVKDGKCFDGWRKSYCQKVVDLYCNQYCEPISTWAEKYENITLGNIAFYTDKHASDQTVKDWLKRINDVKALQQAAK